MIKLKKNIGEDSTTLIPLTSMFAEPTQIKLAVDFDDVWFDIVTHDTGGVRWQVRCGCQGCQME